jgi:hypothetical protein
MVVSIIFRPRNNFSSDNYCDCVISEIMRAFF